MSMEIIMTGSTGFVGTNLSKYLSTNGYGVNPISLRKSIVAENLQGKIIIHLAGKAHDTKKLSDASEYFKINTVLTEELFNAFLESDVNDFIYFSSVKAVADEVVDTLDENHKPNPKTSYGLSKLQAEQCILSKNLPFGKRVFIIRPCMIHGPGNKGNLNLLYNVVKKRIPYPLADFENERSFLGIDNLNFMIKEILENRNVPSGVYNFADDEVLSTNELVEIISTVLNKKNRYLKIPKVIINGIAKFGDIIKLPLNSESVQKLTENYRVSNQKIKTAIGIDKLPNTAQEGLEKTLKSFIIK